MVERVVCSLVDYACLLLNGLALDRGLVAEAVAHLEACLSDDIELRRRLCFFLDGHLGFLLLEFASDPREWSRVKLILEELVDANLLVVWSCLS